MSSDPRGDIALLCTLDQFMFWNYIAHKRKELFFVVCLLLKHKNQGISVDKYFLISFFILYHINYNISSHAVNCFSFFGGQTVIRVHNFVQINILIKLHFSDSLVFKN